MTKRHGDKRMTCVFGCDLSALDFNPHTADTPFGRAAIVSVGDICAERDALEDKVADQHAEIERLQEKNRELSLRAVTP